MLGRTISFQQLISGDDSAVGVRHDEIRCQQLIERGDIPRDSQLIPLSIQLEDFRLLGNGLTGLACGGGSQGAQRERETDGKPNKNVFHIPLELSLPMLALSPPLQ